VRDFTERGIGFAFPTQTLHIASAPAAQVGSEKRQED